MSDYELLFQQRLGKILALSKLSQIALEGLSQATADPASKFAPLFKSMGEHIPNYHQNNPTINIPEYRVIGFLDGMTLISTISEVEAYFEDLVVSVICRHPEKIGKTTLDIRKLVEIGTVEAAVELAAQRFASEMLFKRPNDYKKDLLSIISADDTVFNGKWPIFVEAKARRDIGVHNGWVVNEIYKSKLREVGLTPSTEPALSVNHAYLHSLRSSCLEMMNELKVHCEKTFA